jgi:flavin reductase (DIM6/NTAB) family NADH-FMN oxidoreductase RutF
MSAEFESTPPIYGPSAVDPTVLRKTMSHFATGVVILTVGGEHIHAMTANAFSSVSLDPPSVLCSVSHSAVMHKSITASGSFAVSILGADQENLARRFADKSRTLGAIQFEGINWWSGERTGAPLLADSLAWLECELTDSHDFGDHTIFIGTVLRSGQGVDQPGLLFFKGKYSQAATS